MEDDGFSIGSADFSEDEPIEASEAASYHKLDILHSRQINRIMKVNVIVWVFCLVYVMSAAILANTVYLRYKTIKRANNPPKLMRTVDYSPAFFFLEFGMTCLATLGMIILAIVYPLRVYRNNRYPVTDEMIWVSISLVANAFTVSPMLQVLLHLKFVENASSRSPVLSLVIAVMRPLRYCGSGISIIFYLMVTSASYSIMERTESTLDQLWFYCPKLLPLMAYQVIRLCAFFQGKIILSIVPFSNFVGMIANSIVLGQWFVAPTAYVSAITAFEIYFLLCIVIRVRNSARILSEVDYLQFRSKQIGFRSVLHCVEILHF